MKEPIYIKLSRIIEERIHNGIYNIKDRLPSERDIAVAFKVSRMTVRQAISVLEDKGIVYKERGSGTFVKAPSFEQNNVKSFTDTVGKMGYTVKTKLLELSQVHGIKLIAEKLDLPLDAKYFKIKRLRMGNDIPMALEILYVPIQYCEGLDHYNLEDSFYQLLEEVYDTKINEVSYKMEAIIANPIYRKLLELNKATALLKVTGVSIDLNGRKLFYEESIYRSDLYNYRVDIHRKF